MGLEAWLSRFGYTESQLPKIAGKYAGKNLVVCGDGFGVWDDLERLGCRVNAHDKTRGGVKAPDGAHFLVINKLGETFPGDIEHWYSNEAELLKKFLQARRNEYSREFNGMMNTHSMQHGARYKWPLGGHGTSGLGAIMVGLGLGYDRIVICGMPLDNGPHNGEPHWRQCRFETSEAASPKNSGGAPNQYWSFAIEKVFDGRVRSMSGRTRKWLGGP